MIIGITGSIATGKTTVSRILEAKGITVFNDDIEAKKILHSKLIAPLLMDAFPKAFKNGELDVELLRNEVFNNKDSLTNLENIIHPILNQARTEFILSRDKESLHSCYCVGVPKTCRVVIAIDSPLLFEKKISEFCDFVIVTKCSKKTQRERVLARNSLTEEQLKFVLTRQYSDRKKTKLADYVIDTEKPIEQVTKQLDIILETRMLTDNKS